MAARKPATTVSRPTAAATNSAAQPTFPANAFLARYVDEANMGRQNRISSSAFLPAPDEEYLSVNSLEVEALAAIADFYRNHLRSVTGKVAVSCLTVMEYNRACEAGGVAITFGRATKQWSFSKDGVPASAYRLRQTRLSKSHCGVEPVCLMDSLAASRFARNLAGRPPGKNPHWV